MSLHVRDGSSWKEVTASKGIHVRDGGSWKAVKEGYVRDGSSWKSFFVQSDEITKTYTPDWCQAYAETGPKVDYTVDGAFDDGDWIVGDWGSTWNWHDTHTAIGFKDKISADLAVRPVIKSARIRFQARNGAEPSSIRFDLGTFTDSGSEPTTRTWASNNSLQAFDLVPNELGPYTSLNASVISGLQSGMGLSMRHDAGDTIFRGWGDGMIGTPISLEITMDYV